MPQAIEWSLATPMIRPRLPAIICDTSRVRVLEYDAGIGAAEAEGIRQHAAESYVVAPLAQDRHVGEGRIEILDIGALADEAIVHHQERIDRLVNAGRALRVSGKRLGGRDRRALVAGAENLTNR